MRFTDPVWGLLFIPLVVGLALSWHRVHGMAKARKAVSFGLRFLLLGSLIGALMGPQGVQPDRGTTTIFVLDRSDSISERDRKTQVEFVAGAMGSLGEDDKVGIVAFGKSPAMEASPGGRRPFGAVESVVDASASDIASALRLAMASFPSGKGRRIVLVSDGNETKGDALGAVESIAAEGVAIDFVPLGLSKGKDEAAVTDLQAPSEQSAEQPFEIRAVVESTVAQTGQLVIERNGEPVSQTKVSIPAGTSTIVIPQNLAEAGFYRYRAYLRVPNDSDNRNNLGAAFVSVKGRPKVLLAQGDTGKLELASALSQQGISVQVTGPSGVPTRPEDFQQYDAVILNDLNAANTTEPQMKMIRNAIRDSGVGFMMVGGEDSFLPGGWYGTPVAEALPVDLNIRQRKVFPSTAVLIVVDTSGSMSMSIGGMTKLQLAASAAVLSANLLGPTDRLGVAGSGSRIDYVAPIAELKERDAVIAKIRTLKDGGGGIFAEPSVRFASEKLAAENTRVKHFILVADGSDCDAHGSSLAIAAAMKAAKTTVSTVAIGDGKDVDFLKGVAAVGGGRFYLVEDAKKLPQIFTQDVSLMSRSAIEEGAFLPKVLGVDDSTRGIDGFPALMAYCLTDARPLARVSMKTQKDDPLLASWQFGLGKSTAFTSDAQNRWAKEWIGWDGYGRFWAQTVRALTRRAALNNYDLQVTPEGGRGKISLAARDRAGNPLPMGTIDVRVSNPDGGSQKATLTQEAPGVFSGDFEAGEVGSYIVSVVEPSATGQARVASNGFSIPYPPEYRSSRANLPLLEGVAGQTGGKKLTAPKEAMRPLAHRGESVTDLWRMFLFAALALLPLDVLVRRVVVPLPRFARHSPEPEIPTVRASSGPTRGMPAPPKAKSPGRGRKEDRPETPISAAGSLLAAKKKRKDGDSKDP